MKIALIGYGNMGKEIETIIKNSPGDQIVSISYKSSNGKLDIEGISGADIAIDFTSAETVFDTAQKVLRLGIPLVIGTTGWYDKFKNLKKIVEQNNGACVYGQNFSIGANIFFHMLAYGANLVNAFENYDVYGFEIHHIGKKDSPSGTAKKISNILLDAVSSKKSAQFDRLNRVIGKDELHYSSIRGGRNPGRHDVIFDSVADEIHLSHQAHGRSGFAEGALLAARFIIGQKGLYSFDDIFERQVKNNERI